MFKEQSIKSPSTLKAGLTRTFFFEFDEGVTKELLAKNPATGNYAITASCSCSGWEVTDEGITVKYNSEKDKNRAPALISRNVTVRFKTKGVDEVQIPNPKNPDQKIYNPALDSALLTLSVDLIK